MKKAHLRLVPTLLAESFVMITAGKMALEKDLNRLLFAALTAGLLLMPFCLERLLEKRLSLPLLWFFQLYALGPMLGKCWRLYQSVPLWDKLLHFTGGVVFALVGLWLWEWKIGKDRRLWAALFGLCFSVFISAAWEIGEFAADLFFGWILRQIPFFPRSAPPPLGQEER